MPPPIVASSVVAVPPGSVKSLRNRSDDVGQRHGLMSVGCAREPDGRDVLQQVGQSSESRPTTAESGRPSAIGLGYEPGLRATRSAPPPTRRRRLWLAGRANRPTKGGRFRSKAVRTIQALPTGGFSGAEPVVTLATLEEVLTGTAAQRTRWWCENANAQIVAHKQAMIFQLRRELSDALAVTDDERLCELVGPGQRRSSSCGQGDPNATRSQTALLPRPEAMRIAEGWNR
jgi:hypothetical protein